jgi:hypothetical protein
MAATASEASDAVSVKDIEDVEEASFAGKWHSESAASCHRPALIVFQALLVGLPAQNIAALLETTAKMAKALSAIDATTAKKARKHSVTAIETAEVSTRADPASAVSWLSAGASSRDLFETFCGTAVRSLTVARAHRRCASE